MKYLATFWTKLYTECLLCLIYYSAKRIILLPTLVFHNLYPNLQRTLKYEYKSANYSAKIMYQKFEKVLDSYMKNCMLKLEKLQVERCGVQTVTIRRPPPCLLVPPLSVLVEWSRRERKTIVLKNTQARHI